ncbi:hypothetical protein CBS101457_005390 [Exobasidium rhododendri]|nr:hypothetical protein CBS101457_005390 [Exobasidium rhododendri]
MFKASNPYDEIVVKATDENLTSENWQLNLDVCDKVTSDGPSGSRNCVAAILKRLVHRNANVQLYSLTLSDALSKNCGEIAHQELASRSFTQTLQRIITDRNTHDTVKKKGLALIKEWNQEWGNDESLGLIRETMESLRKQGLFVEEQREAAPVEPSSDRLRAEDEELRKVLELSLQDQGGRGGGGAASFPSEYRGASEPSSAVAARGAQASHVASSGYNASSSLNKNLPDPSRQSSGSNAYPTLGAAAAPPPASSSAAQSPPPPPASSQLIASRVRALYDFTPTESGELAFRKGDILRVLDSVYEHWWRGEVNGEVGIFPVNFVEVLPDPTPADLQREAEMEAKIFAQANNIDRLLSKLRGLDPARDNLAEDEELQELYQSSLSMRPKIVRLIDRYNIKVNELRTMNEKFVRARSTFDVMMEQSLAKYNPSFHREDYTNARPEYDYSAAQNGYQQAPQQHQQAPYQQPPPQGGEGQQQEYAQSWAAYCAQQGYQQPPTGSQSSVGAPPPPSSQHPSHASSTAPPNVNDPAYAQWYYSQQQQQQQPQLQQQSAPSNAPPQSSPPTGYEYTEPGQQQQQQQANDSTSSLHDQDKRAMFERARAEAEAYHRAHQQHAASGASSEARLQ